MLLNKWDYSFRKYERVELPDGNYKSYCNDMNEIINCPHCQKKLRYGDGYTSLVFHTQFGFGYCVCKECYEKELKERAKYSLEDYD